MMFKKEIRIIGWDDCRFSFHSKKVKVVGIVFRGGQFIDGLLSTFITKDGLDATDNISKSITKSRHYDQLSLIMLDGITFGGFNLIDIKKLYNITELPVIAVQRKKPDIKQFKEALKVFHDNKNRNKITENAGNIYMFKRNNKKIFYQKYGLNMKDCEEILAITCIRSNVPEPIRVAHLIASGLSGESRGRA